MSQVVRSPGWSRRRNPGKRPGLHFVPSGLHTTHSTRPATHICIDKHPPTPQLGNVDYREIILGKGTCLPPEDATAPWGHRNGQDRLDPGPYPPIVPSSSRRRRRRIGGRRDPNTSETCDTLGDNSMGYALHVAEKSPSRSPGRIPSHSPMVMRQAALPSQGLLQPKTDPCACGGSCPRCQEKLPLQLNNHRLKPVGSGAGAAD
jgi:hypothetical protein